MSKRKALMSCTDKTGLVPFATFLIEKGFEILSTGGTAALLRENNIPVTDVSTHTGSPEILDGRVKTLHPKIHGALLGVRGNSEHERQMHENGIDPIELVVVNLYEFEKTISRRGATLDEAIENIDIGGPSMLRSAAKNYKTVTVIADPADYVNVMREMAEQGEVSLNTREKLALKVFQTTARYDASIATYLAGAVKSQQGSENEFFPSALVLNFQKLADLRYGENPHQQAAFYRSGVPVTGIVDAVQLWGKELSYNNILDLDSAHRLCREFTPPACVIVKHTNPCGVAVAERLSEAFIKSRSTDPVSSFGGIIALNRPLDEEVAKLISETFFEAVIAPDYSAVALELLKKKKNLRLLSLKSFADTSGKRFEYKTISGGLLVQEEDLAQEDLAVCKVVTRRKPTHHELLDLDFVWRIVKHVKSNAIVFGRSGQALGVGAGQMSRVDSVKLAIQKAQEAFGSSSCLQNSVLASDAFFPFRDGVDVAAQQGVTAIVQPGGSVRDEEVIQAANEKNLAMIFTGARHFKH